MINFHQSPTQERRENAISQNRAISFFNSFLQSLKGETVGIFHHTDSDGISSGIILGELVKHYTRKNPKYYPTTYTMLQKGMPLQHIQKDKITKALFIDLGVDSHQDFVQKISKEISWFLIDHHELYNDADNIIKPQKFTTIPASRYPCGKLSYDLAQQHMDITSKDWIACLGIIGDMAVRQWQDFINATFKKYGWEKKENYYDTVPGEVCKLETSIEALNDTKKLKQLMNTIQKAKKPEDVLRSPLRKIHEAVEKEINSTVEKIEKENKDNKYIYAEINPKYDVKSPISSILGVHNQHKTIIMVSKSKGSYHISGRRSDGKYPVSTLIRTAIEGMPNAIGGGHPQAAGGSVPTKYYTLFKKRILEDMERQE